MTFCHTCGMPLQSKEDFALGDETSEFCTHCVNEDGSVKSCGDIFEGGVEFFLQFVENDRALAERVTRKNMSQLPYWKEHPCDILSGDMATDEEFQAALSKM